ncbi:hypothetical protein NDS46_30620 (plasmid) [Paenibacillus thiaminolyticus]|uniref:hypothetical protein n=1 Tax=Paenibacillus thiaminolyticus TaxID=49283 RepID=UPI00232EB422|nr:hypothetical protein [Paenibacillus thiaminolyticus]WCF11704.1 hypothetical protein NDS46_30620 [Paenibacillus thiaminolyticus]
MLIVTYKVKRNDIETTQQIELSDDELIGLNEQERFEEIYTWILFKESKYDKIEIIEEIHVPGSGGVKSETLYDCHEIMKLRNGIERV